MQQPTDARGAPHVDLEGSPGALRFRPPRIAADQLKGSLTCSFESEGASAGTLRVLDVSPTGVGFEPLQDTLLPPGSPVRDLELQYQGRTLWRGDGVVVHQIDRPCPRVGVRFTSGLFPIERLRLHDSPLGERVSQWMGIQERYEQQLPHDWRVRVAEVRQMLEMAKKALSELGEMDGRLPSPALDDERALFDVIYAEWGPAYQAKLCDLYESSRALSPEIAELARSYATRELLPLLYECPMHRRGHDKPRGYAGDYEMMRLYFVRPQGNTLYGRFIHHVAHHYSLCRSVVAREEALRARIHEAVADGPARIVSLASGPAIEVQRFIREESTPSDPVEFILLDQDEEALNYCHRAISHELVQRDGHSGLIDPHCLHFSVRQILKPQTADEDRVVTERLGGASLIYSAGLLDYLPQPVARRLVTRLYHALRPGGRLFIGNLRVAPDTTWVMEYVLAWHLEYRTSESMRDLARELDPPPARVDVVTDDTGYCLFLDVTRGSASTG